MTLTREQLRAARALQGLRADELARLARVGVATLRRFEAGAEIGPLHLDAIKDALESAGVVLIAEGTEIDGVTVSVGVALKRKAAFPPTPKA